VLIGEVTKYIGIDRIVAKRLRVLLQTDSAEPTVDVQVQSPGSCQRQFLKRVESWRPAVPRYYFTIRSCDHERKDEHRVVLRDVSAAFDYACRMVRELTASGYNDPGLLVIVRNEMRQRVLSIPSLPACA
jgi:hypothetical protein